MRFFSADQTFEDCFFIKISWSWHFYYSQLTAVRLFGRKDLTLIVESLKETRLINEFSNYLSNFNEFSPMMSWWLLPLNSPRMFSWKCSLMDSHQELRCMLSLLKVNMVNEKQFSLKHLLSAWMTFFRSNQTQRSNVILLDWAEFALPTLESVTFWFLEGLLCKHCQCCLVSN